MSISFSVVCCLVVLFVYFCFFIWFGIYVLVLVRVFLISVWCCGWFRVCLIACWFWLFILNWFWYFLICLFWLCLGLWLLWCWIVYYLILRWVNSVVVLVNFNLCLIGWNNCVLVDILLEFGFGLVVLLLCCSIGWLYTCLRWYFGWLCLI